VPGLSGGKATCTPRNIWERGRLRHAAGHQAAAASERGQLAQQWGLRSLRQRCWRLGAPALTQYAECMRAHDINMLDPNQRGELDLGGVPGLANNGFGRNSPHFHAADSACRRLLPPGIADDGTGR